MSSNPRPLAANLFYSYSHKDTHHREDMERTLSMLRQNGLINDSSDEGIVPGQSISAAIDAKLRGADIVAFLISSHFLDSEECRKEWALAKDLAAGASFPLRVPIIVRECAWQDFLADDDVKALPRDGKAITAYCRSDFAWKEVYDGIKSAVESFRTTYTAKSTFLADIKRADLPSATPMTLKQLFVFPRLTKHDSTATSARLREPVVSSADDLLHLGHTMIHGQEKSGKTALARHIVLSLVDDSQPVLFADLGAATGHLGDKFLRRIYEEQFNGDYFLWQKQECKTLVIDNMTDVPQLLDFVEACSDTFSRICLFVSSDVFHSFLFDEKRLARFQEVRIEPLTPTQQERLIRNRLNAIQGLDALTDGFVDEAEDRVNSIIISNKIVPRYPFFVLSILQTYDVLMPPSLSITSYGHCYYVFIVASLCRAGISDADDAINSSFNFAEQLALANFRSGREAGSKPYSFSDFKRDYRSKYFMATSLVNRLTHKDYGIITADGKFTTAYMYYFFLGKLLATDRKLAAEYLPELCEHSYEEGNYLTLLFAIHHAPGNAIIDEILLRTMVEFDDVKAATLRQDETASFASIVSELPESVLSRGSVEDERAKVRQEAGDLEEAQGDDGEGRTNTGADQTGARMLRVFRNNKILGQVLRNQYGKLPKRQIEDIVETIADSSFRIIKLGLSDEDEVRRVALRIKARYPNADLAEVQQVLRYFSFIWTMVIIEEAVHAVSVPSIRDAVDAVVARNSSPAYEIFGYFCKLDSAGALTNNERDALAVLYKEHSDEFIKRVLSLRTQSYMNTHRSKMNIEQSVCSVLGLPYRPQPNSGRTGHSA